MTIEEKINELTVDDMIGQTLCYDIYAHDNPEEVEAILKKIRPGGIFLVGMTTTQIKTYTDMANKYTKVPVIVASDIENGPYTAIVGSGDIPHEMAWGACDDADLIKKAGRAISKICRKNFVIK